VLAMINDMSRDKTPPKVVRCLAKEILDKNGDPVQALAAAVETERIAPDSKENIAAKSEARRRIIEKLLGLLNANPWKEADLREAVTVAQNAMQISPKDEALAKIRADVEKESADYGMVLVRIASSGAKPTAIFRVTPPGTTAGAKEVWVSVGDVIADRFEITRIGTGNVRIRDKQRNDREFNCGTDGSIY
jgi:hypothetical protein